MTTDPRVLKARSLIRDDDALDEKSLKGRLCLGCRHLSVDNGDGWEGSTETPPSSAAYICDQITDHIGFVTDVQNLRQLRFDLMRAQTCPHYSPEPWAR